MPTSTATSRRDGLQLAHDLRKALDDLMDVGEEAGELICIIEDSYGINYPAADGERPTAAEQAAAKIATPGTLEALAKAENQLRKQLWFMAKARRGLARMVRKGEHHG
jgi:hypothetical protein